VNHFPPGKIYLIVATKEVIGGNADIFGDSGPEMWFHKLRWQIYAERKC
jgi:hypothetical protein